MNLGQFLSLEAMYLDNKNGANDTKLQFLIETHRVSEDQVEIAKSFYSFAKKNFTSVQWNEFERLLQISEEAKNLARQDEKNAWLDKLGVVLWGMGDLFGTNILYTKGLN